METRGKKVVRNQENSITSARGYTVQDLRLTDRLTVELAIFLFESGGHKTIER